MNVGAGQKRTGSGGPAEAGRGFVRFRLVIAYDGTAYQGWQAQRIGRGVQAVVEEAFTKIFHETVRVHGSSRTDTGVHALGLVAHADVPKARFRMSARKLRIALNAWLPEDVRILQARRSSPRFHARFEASGKQYRYFVWNCSAMNPLLRRNAWHVPAKLNLRAMTEAAPSLVGRHDFRSMTTHPGKKGVSTVRTVRRCEIQRDGSLLTFIIEGDGFLYRMCRAMVGTLVQVGQGKWAAEDVAAILQRADRRGAGMTAPAHGLVLWRVFYPPRGQGKGRDAAKAEAAPRADEGAEDEGDVE